MKNKLPEKNESRDNEKIQLSNNQQNPGAAKPEQFEVQSEIPGHGQRGESKAEYARLKRSAEAKNRQATPDRNDPNNAEKPLTGSHLG